MADIPESTKMLPCPNPWCENIRGVEAARHITTAKWHICCGDCLIDGPWADTCDLAIAAWNTRAAPPAPIAEGVTCVAKPLTEEERKAAIDKWMSPPAMDREAVLEALELADATLRGANMDRAFVERKVTAAITGLKSTSTVPADTMVILHALLTEYAGQPNQAGEAYKLVDATLSADAIRQGEGRK